MTKPGTLLISHPDLVDNFFQSSVILITESHHRGVIGLAINKLSSMPLSQAMNNPNWRGPEDLYCGGPNNTQALLLLHSANWISTNTVPVDNTFSISSDMEMTSKISRGQVPDKYKFVYGMSSWYPGQLDVEIATGKWLTIPATEDIVYNTASDDLWKKSIESCAKLAVDQYF